MLCDEHLELAHEGRVPAGREVHVDPVLDTGEAKLFDAADLALGEALIGEVGQRLPSPQGQGLGELACSREAAETLKVELVVLHAKQVAGRSCLESFSADRLAEL